MNSEEEYIDEKESSLIKGLIVLPFIPVLGVWMMIDPSSPFDHSNRAIMSIIIDLWSLGFGVFLTVGGGLLILDYILKFKLLRKIVWNKDENQLVLYDNRTQILNYATKSFGEDVIAFYPEKKLVLRLPNYKKKKNKRNKYRKAISTDEYDCDSIYWYADQEGLAIIYKGAHRTDISTKKFGNDLEVQFENGDPMILLKNYSNLLDNELRKI
ncbi:MAG: hypothetical protein QNK23_02640 [Crocinitomicaceae bacterium]|nr:hypothetical protein [Crocinitomicaceae bacterium]